LELFQQPPERGVDAMPMKKGYGKKTVSKNIKNEMKSGKPQRQAVAMAMDSARRSKKPKGTLE